MALRRFEGELRDHRDNPVVSAVLTAGFRDRHLDPLDLPGSMPMRQRCSMLMQAAIWKEAYLELEADFIRILGDRAADVDQWLQVGTEAPLAAGA